MRIGFLNGLKINIKTDKPVCIIDTYGIIDREFIQICHKELDYQLGIISDAIVEEVNRGNKFGALSELDGDSLCEWRLFDEQQ